MPLKWNSGASSFWPVYLLVSCDYVPQNLCHNFCTIRDRDFIFCRHTELMKPFQIITKSKIMAYDLAKRPKKLSFGCWQIFHLRLHQSWQIYVIIDVRYIVLPWKGTAEVLYLLVGCPTLSLLTTKTGKIYEVSVSVSCCMCRTCIWQRINKGADDRDLS